MTHLDGPIESRLCIILHCHPRAIAVSSTLSFNATRINGIYPPLSIRETF